MTHYDVIYKSSDITGASRRASARLAAAWPAKRFPDRDEIAAVRAETERISPGRESPSGMRVAGRVMARRGHGKLTFLDLVDRSGRIQLLCAEDRCGPVDLNLGDIVGASGFPARTRRGEPSLAVEEIEVLAPTRKPLPDIYHGLVDTETRYRKRYLDLLVNEESRADFILRSRMVTAIRRYLDSVASSRSRPPCSNRATVARSRSRS